MNFASLSLLFPYCFVMSMLAMIRSKICVSQSWFCTSTTLPAAWPYISANILQQWELSSTLGYSLHWQASDLFQCHGYTLSTWKIQHSYLLDETILLRNFTSSARRKINMEEKQDKWFPIASVPVFILVNYTINEMIWAFFSYAIV